MAQKTRKTGKKLGPAKVETKRGTLIIIGGGERKDTEGTILQEVAGRVGTGKLVVATIATAEPEETWKEYRQIFKKLGVKKVEWLDIRVREEGFKEEVVRILDGATVIFFTGGDQLKITSQLGDSLVYRRIEEIYEQGGTIAGTSAGASVMSETMLISGDGDESHKVDAVLGMAPGLGFIRNAVIDQHFAQRGRLGRLLGAITQNPRTLGIGLDENTAIVLDDNEWLEVVGAGAVYVLDGSKVSYSNLAEPREEMEKTMSVFDVKLHVLSAGNRFDLQERRPEIPPKPEEEAMRKSA
ncbi:MAG: cyanophycinase [Acidobacteria bacterium]|nr:MAG: cyanophycinase [Acidobacteriota bacterium]